MAGVAPPVPATGTNAFTDPNEMLGYITSRAQAYGLDPEAVLAVAAHEGISLPAQVGDNGTSFGPWQLHAGGALPASVWAQGPAYAQQWANSPTGIDYALQKMSQVAAGLKGQAAIANIVFRFERPTNPNAEATAATATYNQGGGPSIPNTNLVAAAGDAASGALQHVPGVAQAEAVSSFLGKLTDPSYILRGLQVIGGAALVIIGVVLLARQVALAADVPDPVNAAVNKVPAVSAARESRAQSRAYEGGRTQGRRQGARREGRRQGEAEIARRERVDSGPQPVYSGRARSSQLRSDEPIFPGA